MKLKLVPEKYRELSEIYFKLGLGLEYGEHYETAIEYVEQAMECLKKRSSMELLEDEKQLIEEFLVEMQTKISDIKLTLEKESEKEQVGESSKQGTADVKVNDVSMLVKKRKADPVVQKVDATAESAKKLKNESIEQVNSNSEADQVIESAQE